MNQSFQKYNSFRDKLKNKEYIMENKNSDEENGDSLSRIDSSVINETEDSKEKVENKANNINKSGNLKALFTGEWEEMQKKKEQEFAKQNKKKIITVENLPTLGNFNLPNEENNIQIINDALNNNPEKIQINVDVGIENKDVNLNSVANNINLLNNGGFVLCKKANKKTNAKKKFVNLDFGMKLGFQKQEEDTNNIDDLPEEDILVKNLVNMKPRETKKKYLTKKEKK
jgi:hypothetical protein